VKRVQDIIKATGCKVVLSSSWRLVEENAKAVQDYVCEFIDKTPRMPRPVGTSIEACERGHEIQAWLDKHPEVKRFAILDDDMDMLPEQLDDFFKTSWQIGLTEPIKRAVINHLNK